MKSRRSKGSKESINDLLNSCIQIKSIRISRQVSIPQQICFCLDAQLLGQVNHIAANQASLTLSPSNLAKVRHYALLRLASEQEPNLTQSDLTFSTQYVLAHNQTVSTLLRSVISLDGHRFPGFKSQGLPVTAFRGQISQQIKQELTQNQLLLQQVSQAHYWLITEILAQLPLRAKTWCSWLLISCLAIALIILSIFLWHSISVNYLLKLIICLSIFSGLILFAYLPINQYLKSWLVSYLLPKLLLNNIINRQLSWKILSFLL